MKLSVIIPSYRDPLLQKTVDSLLQNSELGDQLEIICVLDGYWCNPPLLFSEEDNKRVKQLHLGKNRGMREAINAGVRASRGEFIVRFDEHCMVCPSWDRILLERFKDNWVVYFTRYYLDPVKWQVMDKEPNVYNKLVIDQSRNKFSGVNWKTREKERPDKLIDPSMAMQGSMYALKRSWWDQVVGELQTEGYGPLYGDSHEIVFKTWKAGGHLMVNKNGWYAHKDRSFSRTHNDGTRENPANKEAGWKYSLDLWSDYYHSVIKPKWNI